MTTPEPTNTFSVRPPLQDWFVRPHDWFDRRLDARQPFSLRPGVRTPCGMAHDGRDFTKIKLRLQVLYAHTSAEYQPSGGLENQLPLRFLSCCPDSPVDASTFESPSTSASNHIHGRGEGDDLSTTFRVHWPSRNITPSITLTTSPTDHTYEGDTLVCHTQRA